MSNITYTCDKIKRRPGAGRKRKIPLSEIDNILKSKLSVNQLAEKYNVGRHTIYLIYKNNRAFNNFLKSA